MAWIWLITGGIFEIVWAVGFRYVKGTSTPVVLAGVLASMALSLYFYWLGVKTIPVGTAYAVWTGIGASGAALFGIIVLGEPANAARLACLVMVVAGLVGLKVFA